MNFAPVILLMLLGSAVSNGDDKLSVTISTNPPLSGLICINDNIIFTCHVQSASKLPYHYQYQWSTDGGQPKIGDATYSMVVPPQSVIVTCGVFATYEGSTQYVSKNITVQPIGAAPKIAFQYVTNNFVYKLTRRPFNLTAIVVSNLNLTSLHWSPPEQSGPSKTVTVRHGDITTTTLMLLENATLGDSGNYTLTANNECGCSLSQVYVKVLTDCPLPKFTLVQPSPSFTAVEGYNTTLTCSYDGYYSESSPIRVWLKLPNHTPVWLNEIPYLDCNCSVEHRFACPVGTDPNDCCRFELLIHSTSRLDDNGTVFSCNQSFADEYTSWMAILPSPKVLRAPRNVNVAIGSEAVFTCDFEASTDSRISQILWKFNGTDLAGCRRFQDLINCTVTQSFTDTNYISSTLEIYPVQADNAGQYTCYCSYDTSILNVDGTPTIQSYRKSATLSISDSSHGKHINSLFIIVGASVGSAIILAIFIIIIIITLLHCRKRRKGYQYLSDNPESPGRVVILNSGMISTSHQNPVGGPGPLISISRHDRILPGMNSHQTEMRSFHGVLRYGFPPLTVLTPYLQEEWKVFGEHMGLQLSLLEQIKQKYSSETIACCWAVCHHWLKCNKEATWNDLLNKLVSPLLQWNAVASGLNHYLKSLLADTDGQSKERKNSVLADTDSQSKDRKNMISILLKRFKEIVELVNPQELMVQLATHGLVTADEQYMLENRILFSQQERNRRLVILLQSKDPSTCVQLFYKCLRAEEEHTGHKRLADLLESDISEFENQHQITTRGPGVSDI